MSHQTQSHSATTGYEPIPAAERRPPTLWVGPIWFAAVMMIIVGAFSVVEGAVAVFNNHYYRVSPSGLLVFDMTRWGWVHLIIGGLAIVAGLALFTGAMWARVVTVALAAINAIAQLAFISANPVWSVIVLTLDVIVIWAVIVHGSEAKSEVA